MSRAIRSTFSKERARRAWSRRRGWSTLKLVRFRSAAHPIKSDGQGAARFPPLGGWRAANRSPSQAGAQQMSASMADGRSAGYVVLVAVTLALGAAAAAGEIVTVDLTRWMPPDIATVGDDPLGQLVKYGRTLVADTANQIGP